MTAQPLFDTARFRDRLTSSGMPEPQARAVTEGFDEALRGATATKADVDKVSEHLSAEMARVGAEITHQGNRLAQQDERLRSEIAQQGERLRGEITQQGDRLGGEIVQQGERFSSEIKRLDTKIDGLELRLNESIGRQIAESQATLIRWFLASFIAGFGLLFAALKLFP